MEICMHKAVITIVPTTEFSQAVLQQHKNMKNLDKRKFSGRNQMSSKNTATKLPWMSAKVLYFSVDFTPLG